MTSRKRSPVPGDIRGVIGGKSHMKGTAHRVEFERGIDYEALIRELYIAAAALSPDLDEQTWIVAMCRKVGRGPDYLRVIRTRWDESGYTLRGVDEPLGINIALSWKVWE